MLGLAEQVGGDDLGVGGVVGDDGDLRRAGEEVDRHAAEQLALRLGEAPAVRRVAIEPPCRPVGGRRHRRRRRRPRDRGRRPARAGRARGGARRARRRRRRGRTGDRRRRTRHTRQHGIAGPAWRDQRLGHMGRRPGGPAVHSMDDLAPERLGLPPTSTTSAALTNSTAPVIGPWSTGPRTPTRGWPAPTTCCPPPAAPHHSGGLSVSRFLKPLTYQRVERSATPLLAEAVETIATYEGMDAHRATATMRPRALRADLTGTATVRTSTPGETMTATHRTIREPPAGPARGVHQ